MSKPHRKKIKIVIAGPFSAGKTHFITTASELGALSTETTITDETSFEKAYTTVAMDFGCVKSSKGHTLYLFGTPGQERFEFMWEILTVGMHALFIIVDSTDLASAKEAKAISNYYYERFNIPIIVAANKQDLSHARTTEQMYSELDLHPSIPLIPLAAKDKHSVKLALEFVVRETENWLY